MTTFYDRLRLGAAATFVSVGCHAGQPVDQHDLELLRTFQGTCLYYQNDFSRIADMAKALSWRDASEQATARSNEPARGWLIQNQYGAFLVMITSRACSLYGRDANQKSVLGLFTKQFPKALEIPMEQEGVLTRFAFQLSAESAFAGLVIFSFESGTRGGMIGYIPQRIIDSLR